MAGYRVKFILKFTIQWRKWNCGICAGLHVSLEYGRQKYIDLQNFERDIFWKMYTSKTEKKMEGNIRQILRKITCVDGGGG